MHHGKTWRKGGGGGGVSVNEFYVLNKNSP